MTIPTRRTGGSLIETIAAVAVAGLIAGAALPRFYDYSGHTKTEDARALLAGVRASLEQHAALSAEGGTPVYPGTTDLVTPGVVLEEPLPPNPFTGDADVRRVQDPAEADRRGITDHPGVGWNYYYDNDADPPVAVLWLNSEALSAAIDRSGQRLPASRL